MTTTNKIDICVSYHRQDQRIAHAVVDVLEHTFELKCWIAPRDQSPGRSTWQVIADMQRDGKILIFLSSSAVLDRINRHEMLMALNCLQDGRGSQIIPLLIEECEVPCMLKQFQIIECRGRKALEIGGLVCQAYHSGTSVTLGRAMHVPNGTKLHPSFVCLKRNGWLVRSVVFRDTTILTRRIQHQLRVIIHQRILEHLVRAIELIPMPGRCSAVIVPFIFITLLSLLLPAIASLVISIYWQLSFKYLIQEYFGTSWGIAFLSIPAVTFSFGLPTLIGLQRRVNHTEANRYRNSMAMLNASVNRYLHLIFFFNGRELDIYKYDLRECKKTLSDQFSSLHELTKLPHIEQEDLKLEAIENWQAESGELKDFIRCVNAWSRENPGTVTSRHSVVVGTCFCSFIETKYMLNWSNGSDNHAVDDVSDFDVPLLAA